MVEQIVTSPLLMDRAETLGNSLDQSNRRALHVLNMSASMPNPWVYFDVAYPTTTREIYSFYTGAARPGGTLARTVQVEYTDATKNFVASGDRS